MFSSSISTYWMRLNRVLPMLGPNIPAGTTVSKLVRVDAIDSFEEIPQPTDDDARTIVSIGQNQFRVRETVDTIQELITSTRQDLPS